MIDTSEVKDKIFKAKSFIMRAEQDLFYLKPQLSELECCFASEDRIFKTKSLIMQAEQNLFYLKPQLSELECTLENIDRINKMSS